MKIRVTLLLVLCLALGVRLYAAWGVNQSQPDAPSRLSADEPGYDNLARGLLSGQGFTWPGRVPLYPAWVAGLHYVTGYSYARGIYVQCVVGTLAVLLTFILGRDLFGPLTGVLAALGVAVDVILVDQSLRYLSEILFTPLVVAVAICFGRAIRDPSVPRFGWLGVWIGVANLVRPTLVVYPAFAALTIAYVVGVRRAVRPAALVVLASTLVVTPWVIRNYVRYQAIYPLATSNAILWQGSPEYYHLIRRDGYTYMDVWTKVIYGPGNEGHDPGSVEGDRYWTRRALHSIAAEPFVYARFCLEKAVTYWVGDPNADWGDRHIFDYRLMQSWGFSRAQTVRWIVARAFPIAAFVTLLLLRRHWARLIPVTSLLAYTTLLHAITHAEARLSDPFRPLLFVIVAAAICCRVASTAVTPETEGA